MPPSSASTAASTRNCAAMWMRRAPSARRTPISPRRSSTEITITLVMPTPPTTRATAPSASSRLRSAASVVARACEGVGRPGHVDLAGRLGTDRGAQHVAHRLDLVGHRAHVQRRRRRRRVEELGGDRVADQRRRVDVGGQRRRLEDADHGEPLPAEPHPRRRVEGVDRRAGRRRRRRARRSAAGRRVVEEPAVGELAADRVEHVDVGGDHDDAAGDGLVDEVGAPHRRVDRR